LLIIDKQVLEHNLRACNYCENPQWWLYELVGYKGEVNKSQLYQIELYEKAFHFYTEKRFPMAIFLLNRLLKKNPLDYAAYLLLERCEKYQLHAPSKDWQGEYILEVK